MKTQVRHGVFETNSSSQHSLVLLKEEFSEYEEYYLKPEPGVNCMDVMLLCGDDIYGRAPMRILTTFDEKFKYLLVYKVYSCKTDEEAREKAKELIEIYKDYTGLCLDIRGCGEHLKFGYVEGETDLLDALLMEENLSLKEICTNKRYMIIVDGDEYCIWDQLCERGIIDTSKIEKEWSIA